MVQFLIAAAVILGGYLVIRAFARASPAQMAGLVTKLAGGGLMALAGFIALRGGFELAAPIFAMGLGLLGKQAIFPNGFPWNRKTPGQTSRVTTSLLAMELDHDTGGMEGEVLTGPLAGRKLSSLPEAELKSLHGQASDAGDQSLALLEAWLDRAHADWRERWKEPHGHKPSPAGAMSHDEALAVLGLRAGASADDVRAAHRRLMKGLHPDHGGSDYLAAKINQAKDLLLRE